MFGFSPGLSRSAAFMTLGVIVSTAIPLVISSSALAQAKFSDVQGHWASEFIEVLASKNVIAGFPDGTFKPDQSVTRAQFAAIVRQAFNENKVRAYPEFRDVPRNYWAAPAIEEAYETGFMSGYPGNIFQPNQQISKVQALVSLAAGLHLDPGRPNANLLSIYRDARDIPDYAMNGVAAATNKGLVVNYPNVSFLSPEETATRGDVAAYIYQALVNEKEVKPLTVRNKAFRYIVNATPSMNSNSGIQGQVLIGPICPVLQAETDCSNRPYQASIAILNQNNQVVTRFQTDVGGHFQVTLEPGTYTLRPESTQQLPFAKEKTVTVNNGQFTPVEITYDTGIR
jgi:hypothetical protein